MKKRRLEDEANLVAKKKLEAERKEFDKAKQDKQSKCILGDIKHEEQEPEPMPMRQW